jgi:hypothetical protein
MLCLLVMSAPKNSANNASPTSSNASIGISSATIAFAFLGRGFSSFGSKSRKACRLDPP